MKDKNDYDVTKTNKHFCLKTKTKIKLKIAANINTGIIMLRILGGNLRIRFGYFVYKVDNLT